MDREAWCVLVHRVAKSWTRLRDWTEPIAIHPCVCVCVCVCVCARARSVMSDLYNPMDCSPPGSSSVHGISQARILEWIAISISRGSSQSRDQTTCLLFGRHIFYHWATMESHLHCYSDLLCPSTPILLWLQLLRTSFSLTWTRTMDAYLFPILYFLSTSTLLSA